MKRIFGEIENIIEGDLFDNRVLLAESKVHKPHQSGISGSEKDGADSIVISGGYEDDEDSGDLIVYTGQGGRSSTSNLQVADQTLTRGNKALAISCEKGLPVRVIRGANKDSKFSPENGYRYDGLFRVEEYWTEKGKSGYVIWRFRLRKIYSDYNSANNEELAEPKSNYGKTQRKDLLTQRIIRNTFTSDFVKKLYNYECQICGLKIETQTGYYAEAAHIKAIGSPHNGPDTKENILCLCPNHHVMFDYGMVSINDDFTILGLENKSLIIHKSHKIDLESLKYHREHFYRINLQLTNV